MKNAHVNLPMRNIVYFLNIVSFIVCMCLVSFFWYSRFVIFMHMYSNFTKQVEAEKWLLSQCGDEIFFSEMQLISDICKQVIANSQDSPFLHAVYKTFGSGLTENEEL